MSTATRAPARAPHRADGPKPEAQILFQQFFKSVGPRTYAAQVKQASNGNQFIVLTEGKRDEKTGEVRKTRLFVFSEDFEAFFGLLRETAQFCKAHPLPKEVREKRQRFWAKQAKEQGDPAGKNPSAPPAPPPPGSAAPGFRRGMR